MRANNWNRWGESDEAGAPNMIGRNEVRAAAALVRDGRVLSLAQPISSKTLVPQIRSRVAHMMTRDGGDYAAGARRASGFQFADDAIFMPLHVGTHIDALCHAWYDGKLYNGFPGDSVRSQGAQHCGVDKLPPLVARGVLLDVVGLLGGPLADGSSIGRDTLEQAVAAAGTTLAPGDVVVIRTGWLERHEGLAEADFDTEPGLDVEAAEWLAAADVAAIGADNFAIEAMPFPAGTVFPVHQRLIRDFGIPLIEGMVLKPLAETGRNVFAFVAAPLPIVGATGSPLTPLAIL